jgi:hypothetical protein
LDKLSILQSLSKTWPNFILCLSLPPKVERTIALLCMDHRSTFTES